MQSMHILSPLGKNYFKLITKQENFSWYSEEALPYFHSYVISLFQENTTHFGHSKAGGMSMKKKKIQTLETLHSLTVFLEFSSSIPQNL